VSLEIFYRIWPLYYKKKFFSCNSADFKNVRKSQKISENKQKFLFLEKNLKNIANL